MRNSRPLKILVGLVALTLVTQLGAHERFAVPENPELSLQSVNEANLPILMNLAHAYEAEFSPLTGKEPNASGIFELDTPPKGKYIGYLLYYKEVPAGFCVLDVESSPKDVAEFYIAPIFRRQQFGQALAHAVFQKHPGPWQVRQIEGADHAIHFWRKAIGVYTKGNYQEAKTPDPDWGTVTKQTFIAKQ